MAIGVRIPISFRSLNFSSKDEAYSFFDILRTQYPIQKRISNPKHHEALIDLIYMRENPEDKIKTGIDYFYIDRNPWKFHVLEFRIKYLDGLSDDLSYRKTIDAFWKRHDENQRYDSSNSMILRIAGTRNEMQLKGEFVEWKKKLDLVKHEPRAPVRKQYIYYLADENGLICYVGRTKRPESRLNEHVCETASTKKGKWIVDMKTRGHIPSFVIIDIIDDTVARRKEQEWIEVYKRTHDLLNGNKGG